MKLCFNILLSFRPLCSPSEPEPEQADLITKVLWTLLCPGSGEEHPYCSHEQSAPECCTNASQV